MRPLLLPILAASALALAACSSDDAPETSEPVAATSGRVLDSDALLGRFPADVQGLPRAATSGDVEGALGYEVSRATATYTNNIDVPGPNVVLNVIDTGSATMTERMGYGWGVAGAEPDTTFEGYPAQIQPRTAGGKTALNVLVGDRFLIEAKGEAVPTETTEDAVRALDLAALAALAGELAQ